MFKRAFGCLGFMMGIALAGFVVYGFFKIPEMHTVQVFRPLLFSCVLIGFGVTWMRGGTFGNKRNIF